MSLVVQNISVHLLGDKGLFHAVQDVSFEVAESTIVDIVGPSGAGKSTLLHALAHQMIDVSGDVLLRGVSMKDLSPQEWIFEVALVQQRPVLLPGTVRDNLLIPWTLRIRAHQQRPDDAHLQSALERAGLSGIALTRPCEQLSVGQQARLAFVRTLLTEPSVLLLDEVDAALDAHSTQLIGEMTSQFAQTSGIVVRVRHREEDGLASMRIHMKAGRVITLDHQMADCELQSEVNDG